MSRIRRLEIKNFRSIKALVWDPAPGINCLIGPGDSGKSTILDAIDLCLGARRNLQIDDADFTDLHTGEPLQIEVTLGDLTESMKNLDTYGQFLRGRNATTGVIEDEPGLDLETVLTVRLIVEADLEPQWKLVSDRSEEQGQVRALGWSDRVKLSPAKIGVGADYHLRWSRGSVLNRISDEKPEVGAALAAAGRDARAVFGTSAEAQLGATLKIVAEVAHDLGVSVGEAVKALLDVHAISFGGGVIALHDEKGIPLRRLGVGSARLLVAGLQRRAADAMIVLVDELEFGLEPHRVVRFLHSLGSKEPIPPLQVFLTTHSPTAVEELRFDQLFITRRELTQHTVTRCAAEVQGALRKSPSAFLAHRVVACEGPSEVGLLRGLDLHRVANHKVSMAARGAALADLAGGTPDRMVQAASAFQALGYKTALVRDDDQTPDMALEAVFTAGGGHVTCCEPGRALEEEIFCSLSPADVGKLVDLAAEIHDDSVVNQQIKSDPAATWDLESVRLACSTGTIDEGLRRMLGRLAKSKRVAWFKTVAYAERVGLEIVGPGLEQSTPEFQKKVKDIFSWMADGDDD